MLLFMYYKSHFVVDEKKNFSKKSQTFMRFGVKVLIFKNVRRMG